MSSEKFRKRLSANDVGTTGGHQGGVLIPKGEKELLAMLPALDQDVKNPDAWIECIDETGHTLKFRFVYYNNRLHDPGGTRNEYRITHMTSWFRDVGAREGDEFEISRASFGNRYSIGIRPKDAEEPEPDQGVRIRLTAWRRVH
ncbi:restriction endonuclease [Rhodobacteraceae bacterium N5(2021)]|uniref:Restriction endonuclease n=1 Tax=Gymnodinialimonas phycosphaerae TaxID=2841589 RepID=A0A975TV42_9RHOB|nr:EcoRII N-terminal effector-binding domain-containing protein [Gymnodinialimonas phycosphaerae]MBY4895304.1 restriction endonuclease [Gymnodinialimonas phycosphaerae]